ncbi:MAG: hypothetical protein PHT48_11975 [Dechloromonas sp.]|nr:hypothetical protein [Dechloromonas sp.]
MPKNKGFFLFLSSTFSLVARFSLLKVLLVECQCVEAGVIGMQALNYSAYLVTGIICAFLSYGILLRCFLSGL